MATFIKDIQEIRDRATQKIEDGAVTQSYGLDKVRAVQVLNEALATEIVCVLRYMHHYFMATGIHGRSVADLFKSHADEEREHADEIAERIQQLGGKPDFSPKTLVERSLAQYVEGETLADMIREDLIAERMVIEVYQRMIEFFGPKDPTTRTLLEHIKGEEEEHASELADMMFIVNPETGEDRGQDPGTDPLGSVEGKRQPARAHERRDLGETHTRVHVKAEDFNRGESRRPRAAWGNEHNVSDGEGNPPRTSHAHTPPQGAWGNEQNASREPRSGSERSPINHRQPGSAEPNIGRNASPEDAVAKTDKGNRSASTSRSGDEDLRTSGNRAAGTAKQSGKSNPAPNEGHTNVTNRPKDEHVTPRAERGTDNVGGTGGRTMNRRTNADPVDQSDVAERPNGGGMGGTNRTPKILQKNRKDRNAA